MILAVCSFAPGFFFVRRLKWGGMETLCGSIALSLILLWLANWTVYVTGVPWTISWILTAGCAVLAFATRRDAARLLRGVRVNRALAAYAFLLVWALALLGIIRHYSGAGWRTDWLEHFQRSLFFLQHFSLNTSIVGGYQVPARPPAMNVLAAFVMAQAGDRFEVFQAVFAFLNALLILPCAMALPILARPRRPGVLPLVAIFAASPVISQNITYTWTKALPGFFIIFALLLYLKAWRKGDSLRMVAAFIAMSMGLLVHYSAGPYLVFLTLHYLLWTLRKRSNPGRELLAIAGCCGALLATWFAWSAAVYGTHATVASNTSVTFSQGYKGSNLQKVGGNLVTSIVPAVLREHEITERFTQPSYWGEVRDHAFVVYQCNVVFCMGAIAGPLVLWIVFTSLRRPIGRFGERGFWIGLIVCALILGIAVVGESDVMGLAHLTLVPLAALGMTLAASRFHLSHVFAGFIIAGCVVDFALGSFLQARIEHLENTPDRLVFVGMTYVQGDFRTALATDNSPSPWAWDNWMRKHQYALAQEWRASVEAFHPGEPTLEPARAEARKRLDQMTQEDTTLWHGWYRRNGGETMYLGDHFGPGDETSVLLVLLFAGLIGKLVMSILPKRQPQPVKRKPPVRRK